MICVAVCHSGMIPYLYDVIVVQQKYYSRSHPKRWRMNLVSNWTSAVVMQPDLVLAPNTPVQQTTFPVLNDHHNTWSPSCGLNELNGHWNGHGHQLFCYWSTHPPIQTVMPCHGDRDMVGNGVERPREVQGNETSPIKTCSPFILESNEEGQA